MVVLCELCGKEMEAEVELQDGQHVVCPHCNGKSTYRKSALRVRQKVAPPAEAAMDAQRMFSRQLTVAEDHLRLLDKINDNESLRRKRETIGVVLVVLAVVLCVVAAYGYVGHRRERRRQAEVALAAERERLEAERMEALHKARELREERIREEEKRREEADRADRAGTPNQQGQSKAPHLRQLPGSRRRLRESPGSQLRKHQGSEYQSPHTERDR